jgi:hypothetical protein
LDYGYKSDSLLVKDDEIGPHMELHDGTKLSVSNYEEFLGTSELADYSSVFSTSSSSNIQAHHNLSALANDTGSTTGNFTISNINANTNCKHM